MIQVKMLALGEEVTRCIESYAFLEPSELGREMTGSCDVMNREDCCSPFTVGESVGGRMEAMEWGNSGGKRVE